MAALQHVGLIMTKGDFPALRMVIEGGRLAPAGQFDQERLNSYRRGTVVYVRFTEEKDRVLVRKWWAILGLVVKQCKTPWKNKEEAHEAIKLALGIVNLSKTVGGQFMQYPKSLADLDDPEMTDALENMTALLSRMTGVDVETLRKETAHIVDHDEATGAIIDHEIQESGAIPSAPDAAEEAALPSPPESAGDPPPADSLSSTADAADSVGGPALAESAGDMEGKVLSPADIPNPEWLQTVARMLWAATNTTGIVDANLELLNNQRIACGAIDGIPSQSDKDKAGSIYKTCKAVVLKEIPRVDGARVIARHAGLEPEAL